MLKSDKMSRLVIKDMALLKILSKHYGFRPLRQKGSHVFLTDGQHYTTIPYHNKELGEGILNKILDDCGLSKEDIIRYL